MMQTSVVMNRVVVIKDQNLELLGRYSTDIIFMQKSSLIENETKYLYERNQTRNQVDLIINFTKYDHSITEDDNKPAFMFVIRFTSRM